LVIMEDSSGSSQTETQMEIDPLRQKTDRGRMEEETKMDNGEECELEENDSGRER